MKTIILLVILKVIMSIVQRVVVSFIGPSPYAFIPGIPNAVLTCMLEYSILKIWIKNKKALLISLIAINVFMYVFSFLVFFVI